MASYRKLPYAILWTLLICSLDGAMVLCPPTIVPCVCDADRPEEEVVVIKRMSCTDFIKSRNVKSEAIGFISDSTIRMAPPDHKYVIERLSLIYAGLTEIPAAAFSRIPALHLDLQGNNFRDRISPRAFAGIARNLRSLNLAWSNVTSLDAKVFRGMVLLRNLSVAENRIQNIPPTLFQHLRALRRLSLAGNPISHIAGTVFRYQTTLEVLDLGYCRLRRLPWTLFIGLWNLRVLDLRGNRLTSVEPYTFIDLSLLDTLLLGHNPLRRLPSDAFHGLQNLAVLRLDESRISSLAQDVFRDLSRLRTLDLGDNAIDYLPPGALALPNLERLHLDGNRLTDFPMDVRLMPALRMLDVSYNRISGVDTCLYGYLRQLDFFNLQQNRLICDCRLLWLRALRLDLEARWKRRLPEADGRQRTPPMLPGRCESPDRLRGVGVTSWLDLDCLRSRDNDVGLTPNGIDDVDADYRQDGCDVTLAELPNHGASYRRRKMRHLAYRSRDLHYLHRPSH